MEIRSSVSNVCLSLGFWCSSYMFIKCISSIIFTILVAWHSKCGRITSNIYGKVNLCLRLIPCTSIWLWPRFKASVLFFFFYIRSSKSHWTKWSLRLSSFVRLYGNCGIVCLRNYSQLVYIAYMCLCVHLCVWYIVPPVSLCI